MGWELRAEKLSEGVKLTLNQTLRVKVPNGIASSRADTNIVGIISRNEQPLSHMLNVKEIRVCACVCVFLCVCTCGPVFGSVHVCFYVRTCVYVSVHVCFVCLCIGLDLFESFYLMRSIYFPTFWKGRCI